MIVNIAQNTDLNKIIVELNNVASYSLAPEKLVFGNEVYDQLPRILQNLMATIEVPSKKDLALLTALGLFSNAIKNLNVLYDDKLEGCQLFLYVLGDPAQGKGFARNLRRVGLKYHKYLEQEFKSKIADLKSSTEEEPAVLRETFFLCSDISKAALARELHSNGGYGVFFETEADTLVSSLKTDHGSFSEILRKGFHGENYSVNKLYMDSPLEIDEVKLSVIITSTLNQCFKLIPTMEDGLFSRFFFYMLASNDEFTNVYSNIKNKAQEAEIDKLEDLLLDIAKKQVELPRLMFQLDTNQQQKMFETFRAYHEKISVKHNELSGSIKRLSLITTRVMMILSYLEHWERIANGQVHTLQCSANVFDASLALGKKALCHLLRLHQLYTKSIKRPQVYLSNLNKKDTTKYKQAMELRQQGYTYRQIALELLGKESLSGTIMKWVQKCEANPMFLFPETETATSQVNPSTILKASYVSRYSDIKNPEIKDERILYSVLTAKPQSYDHYSKVIRELPLGNKRLVETAKKIHFGTSPYLINGSPSNFLIFEITRNANKHIANYSTLKDQLKRIVNVAYVGHTPSDSYVVVIAVGNVAPEKAIEAVQQAFNTFNITATRKDRVPMCWDEQFLLSYYS